MGRQAFMKILIVGCGYFGAELAAYTSRNGCDVYATTRSPAKLELLRQLGTTPIQFDWHSASSFSRLPKWTKCSSRSVILSPRDLIQRGLMSMDCVLYSTLFPTPGVDVFISPLPAYSSRIWRPIGLMSRVRRDRSSRFDRRVGR